MYKETVIGFLQLFFQNILLHFKVCFSFWKVPIFCFWFFFFFFLKLTRKTKTNETSCSKDGLIQPERAGVRKSLGWQNVPKSTSLHQILCSPQSYICSCKHSEDGFRDVGQTVYPKHVHANEVHPEVMKRESSKEEKGHSLAGQGLEVCCLAAPGGWQDPGGGQMIRTGPPGLAWAFQAPHWQGGSKITGPPESLWSGTMRAHWWHARWGASLSSF